MKILTWNLYNLFDEEKELYKENGEKYFLPIDFVSRREIYYSDKIKEINPDIVFFQEVGSEKMLNKIVRESMGENCFVFLAEKDKRGIANACASKIPLTFSEISILDLSLPRFKEDKEEYKDQERDLIF